MEPLPFTQDLTVPAETRNLLPEYCVHGITFIGAAARGYSYRGEPVLVQPQVILLPLSNSR